MSAVHFSFITLHYIISLHMPHLDAYFFLNHVMDLLPFN